MDESTKHQTLTLETAVPPLFPTNSQRPFHDLTKYSYRKTEQWLESEITSMCASRGNGQITYFVIGFGRLVAFPVWFSLSVYLYLC